MYRMRIFILVGRERERWRERQMDGSMNGTEREREKQERGDGWMDMEIDG